jgi:hypothetical protein
MSNRNITLAAALAVLGVPALAHAQVPTVSPNGELADPAKPAPQPEKPPVTVVVPQQGGMGTQTGQGGGAGPLQNGSPETGSGTGYYMRDSGEEGIVGPEERGGGGPAVEAHGGAVPPVHTVQRGDTLWDISWFYFSDPWQWPRVWSYNPEITNPHWIYPGDQVRLVSGGQGAEQPAAAAEPGEGGSTPVQAPTPVQGGFFELRQLAFMDSHDLDSPILIDGSPEEKLMLAAGDEVYLSYPQGKPPRVGQRYSVYQEKKRVKNPTTGKEAGAYVKLVGEVEVVSVKQDKRARAVILDSVEPIERGEKVGPVLRQFKNVEPTPAKVDLEGTIIAEIQSEQLIGARQVVFVDKGTAQGVENGNKMFVIRRGDAYSKVMGPNSNIGKNDTRFPARSIGEVIVVQAADQSSLAVVTGSEQEIGVGDRVLLTRSAK